MLQRDINTINNWVKVNFCSHLQCVKMQMHAFVTQRATLLWPAWPPAWRQLMTWSLRGFNVSKIDTALNHVALVIWYTKGITCFISYYLLLEHGKSMQPHPHIYQWGFNQVALHCLQCHSSWKLAWIQVLYRFFSMSIYQMAKHISQGHHYRFHITS